MDELYIPLTSSSPDGSELADDDALRSSPDGSEPEAMGLEVDELVGPTVKMRMRKVMLGTFDCGGCEVVFARDCVRFFPDEDHAPPSGAGLIEFNLAWVDVDMTKSVLCLTHVFSYKIAGHFAHSESSEGVRLPIPATLHGPRGYHMARACADVKARALFFSDLDYKQFRVSWMKVLRTFPEVQPRMGFTIRDYGSELYRHMGGQLSPRAHLAAVEVFSNVDLLRLVLRFCEAASLGCAGRCCRDWRQHGALHWQRLCRQSFPELAKLEGITDWRALYARAARRPEQRCRQLLEAADLQFAVAVRTKQTGRKILTRAFQLPPGPRSEQDLAFGLFSWEVNLPVPSSLEGAPELHDVLEELQGRGWCVSVTVCHTQSGKISRLVTNASRDRRRNEYVEDDTWEDGALNFALVDIVSGQRDALINEPCVRPMLFPYYKQGETPQTLRWRFELRFGWITSSQTSDIDSEDDELLLQEVTAMGDAHEFLNVASGFKWM